MLKVYFLIAFALFSLSEIAAQDSSTFVTKVFAKVSADSSYIAVNKRAGWQSFVSYLTQVKTDSVLIELVVKNDHTINFKQEQLVGRIKSGTMLPKTGQTVAFNIIGAQYQLRIEPDGRCYLLLVAGSLPTGDPLIIPVRATYKL